MSRSLVLLLALAGSACGGGEGPPAPPPASAGTALVVGTVEIPRDEVERVADDLGLVNPVHTRRALRREALVAWLLPRAATRLAAGEAAFLEARLEAERGLALLRGEAAGEPPPTERRRGSPQLLGFDLWSRAHAVEAGVWTGPFEGIGTWFVVKVHAHGELPEDGRETGVVYEVEWAQWPFAPPGWDAAASDELLERTGVRAVLDEYADLVPWPMRAAR